MLVNVCYVILALIFLLLATGKFKPKTWRGLSERRIQLMRFGCYFLFAVIALNLVGRWLGY